MTNKRENYIYLVEQAYFGNVAQANIDTILDCFKDDCLVTIRHGDNPLRIFRKNPVNNETPLRDFYVHLCGNFDAWFGNFNHYIDTEVEQCACTFTVKLNPKQDSDYLSVGMQTLQNCNFFTYENGKIKEMTIYYSNTEANKQANTLNTHPTGYPKQ
jgi:hypothetical protein